MTAGAWAVWAVLTLAQGVLLAGAMAVVLRAQFVLDEAQQMRDEAAV